jgi:1-acyl-sn-glycerol-3-phosphate acyltransferase
LASTHFLTRCYRITRIVIHTLIGISIASTVFSWCSASNKQKLIKWWCKRLLKHFNLTVIARGNLPSSQTSGNMFVANHISWADIHAINSVIPVRFVAKMEIKNWPVFGYLVKKSGTLFINRANRKDAARIVKEAAISLQQGDNLCFFPEGTTTEGDEILPFKSSIIQAAMNANTQLRPIAIRYVNQDGSINKSASYAGETTLFESMANLLNHPSPVVELYFFEPIQPLSQSRQSIANQAHCTIKQYLNF